MKHFKDSDTMNRKEDSDQAKSATTEENTDLIEELICPQKGTLRTYLAPHKIAEQTRITRSSVRGLIKRRNFVNSKGQKLPK